MTPRSASITATGRQGQPVDPRVSEVYDAKTGIVHPLAVQNGVAKIRLPEGDWNLFTETTEKVDGKWITTIADQPVKVDGGDQQVTVDAREGKPAKIALVHRHADGIPEDPTYNARQKDLAKVTATYRASGVAATGRPLAGFRFTDWPAHSLGWLVGEIKLPGTLTHYRTPGLEWESGLEVGTSLVFDATPAPLKRR
ncbi:hypothetical protein AB0B45_30170 [Nonomuraea sp. NPDC049152]|uniref:hypothetical protein n=1 Tax=Nonomuraea sp. NPDC049152 TaxID=3154350 RepID=UPI0033CA93CA